MKKLIWLALLLLLPMFALGHEFSPCRRGDTSCLEVRTVINKEHIEEVRTLAKAGIAHGLLNLQAALRGTLEARPCYGGLHNWGCTIGKLNGVDYPIVAVAPIFKVWEMNILAGGYRVDMPFIDVRGNAAIQFVGDPNVRWIRSGEVGGEDYLHEVLVDDCDLPLFAYTKPSDALISGGTLPRGNEYILANNGNVYTRNQGISPTPVNLGPQDYGVLVHQRHDRLVPKSCVMKTGYHGNQYIEQTLDYRMNIAAHPTWGYDWD